MRKMYQSIEELHEASEAGKVKVVEIIVDTDSTHVYAEGQKEVFVGAGYDDVCELYEVLFPNAEAHRC